MTSEFSHALYLLMESSRELLENGIQLGSFGARHSQSTQFAYTVLQPAGHEAGRNEAAEEGALRMFLFVHCVHDRKHLSLTGEGAEKQSGGICR